MEKAFSDKIISHLDLREGEPCIKGTRIPISMIGSMAQGLTRDEILKEYL